MKKPIESHVLVPLSPLVYMQWLKLHPRARIMHEDAQQVVVRMTQAQYLAHRAGYLASRVCGCGIS